MPIGSDQGAEGRPAIDFDRVFTLAVAPAIVAAGLAPVRDDQVGAGGLVQKFVFEALLLSPFVVADLTTGNANVLYELGVRHAARRSGTVMLTAKAEEMPFVARQLRCVRYELDATNRLSAAAARRLRAALSRELEHAREDVGRVDSPLVQLVPSWRPGDVSGVRPERWQDQNGGQGRLLLERLEELRLLGDQGAKVSARARTALEALLAEPSTVRAIDPPVLAALLEALSAAEAWPALLDLRSRLPAPLASAPEVLEHVALALLETALEGERSHRMLARILLGRALDAHGERPFARELLARAATDEWATDAHAPTARAMLEQAARSYVRAFQVDLHRPLVGAQALLLLDLAALDVAALTATVRFSAERGTAGADGFDAHAALLMLAVLARDPVQAARHAAACMVARTEGWQRAEAGRALRRFGGAKGHDELPWLAALCDTLDGPDRGHQE